MLKDADPNYFAGIYIVCGYTDLRYGIDSLAVGIMTGTGTYKNGYLATVPITRISSSYVLQSESEKPVNKG